MKDMMSARNYSTDGGVRRLVIFTTHPIQYQVPWFRALADDPAIELLVVFSYVPPPAAQGVGFGTAFSWDIPLFDGYRHRILNCAQPPFAVPAFGQRWARGIGPLLDEFRPDVAMVLGWQEISLVQAVFACRRRGIPIILRGESNAKKQRSRAVQVIHKLYFKLFDGYLAIGKSNADLYLSAGVASKQIVTAGYSVDNDRFSQSAKVLQASRSDLRHRWSIEEGNICFLFVGKLEMKKRVLHFLAALALARQTDASIVGLVVGRGEQNDEANAFVVEHTLPVVFAGFLNQSQITEAYVAADALVLPSDFGETWGLVVNEAMAVGLPVICSDRVGCADDLVLDGVNGRVVAFGDVAAIAKCMVEMSADPERRRLMGQSARESVEKHFSIKRAVEQTKAMFQILDRQAAPL